MSGAPGLAILATGGTGGHVFPAEALALQLRARGWVLALATDARARQWKGALGDVPVHAIHAASPSGGLMGKIGGALQLTRGFVEACALLRRLKPQAVIGFGGYASVPTVWAAARLGIATILHEQNAVLGRANRLLASRVDAIATAFAAVKFLDRAATLTGNPVRAPILALRDRSYRAPHADQRIDLLVFGGSQGASQLSQLVPAAITALSEEVRARLRVTQQCRSEDLGAVEAAYRQMGVPATIAAFFDDIPARLAGAHLVVARAGASTVAELTACGRPSILIPYPHATDDHQTANARALDEVGASIVMPPATADAAVLARHFAELFGAPERLARMAQAAWSLGVPDAATRLADLVDAIAGARARRRAA